MSLEKVLSISEKPGLFKLVTQTRNGFIAESLIDGKRLSVNMNSNVSLLSEKYKQSGKLGTLLAGLIGLISNLMAIRDAYKGSSIIYEVKKAN